MSSSSIVRQLLEPIVQFLEQLFYACFGTNPVQLILNIQMAAASLMGFGLGPKQDGRPGQVMQPAVSSNYGRRNGRSGRKPRDLEGLGIILEGMDEKEGAGAIELQTLITGNSQDSLASAAIQLANGEHQELRNRKAGGGIRPNIGANQAQDIDMVSSTYPGMVNLSGTLCYMNSVLQSFSSLTFLQLHLENIVRLAQEADMDTPVTDALATVLEELNLPSSSSRPAPIRPYRLVDALSTLPSVRRLLQTRDHQDAHELFLLLSNAIAEELQKLTKQLRKDDGLPALLQPLGDFKHKVRAPSVDLKGKARADHRSPQILSPWEGLSANRRSCLKCGYCEAIRYETMGPLDVAVPMSGSVELATCLSRFTAIEVIDDAHCDACTLRLTLAYYESEAERLAQNAGTAKKKRYRDARKIRDKLKELKDKTQIANMEQVDGLEDCHWVRGRGKSAKQAMIARPPPILCLHLVRSEFTPYGQVVKKTPFVRYPLYLDISQFTTSGTLHMTHDGPISRLPGTDWPQPDKSAPPRNLYRLDAIICHYGFTHSFGHFVAYRRKPNFALGPSLPRKSCPDGCTCQDCIYMGPIRENLATMGLRTWLRISDADVEEVTEAEALNERGAAVLLFYERVGECLSGERSQQSESQNTIAEMRKHGMTMGKL